MIENLAVIRLKHSNIKAFGTMVNHHMTANCS
jgi:hypothetical protein